MSQNLQIALLQLDLKWESPALNREMISVEIEKLSDAVDLIVLPEMFTTGFTMNAEALAEKSDGLTFKWLQDKAKQKNAAITGSIIVSENGHYYNRLFFVFPNGNFKIYDKRHTFTLAKEDLTYTAGEERLIVEYRNWRICPLICYDLRFPVWARNTEDYDLLIYVANWPEKRISAWDALLKARAIENMSYCVGVNRTGFDGNGHKYPGHTSAYDALGEPLMDNFQDKVASFELELKKEHLQNTRDKLKFLEDRDQFSLLDEKSHSNPN